MKEYNTTVKVILLYTVYTLSNENQLLHKEIYIMKEFFFNNREQSRKRIVKKKKCYGGKDYIKETCSLGKDKGYQVSSRIALWASSGWSSKFLIAFLKMSIKVIDKKNQISEKLFNLSDFSGSLHG